MAYNESLIAFFPYVVIRHPTQIRGVNLFPVSSIDKIQLSDTDREHVKKLIKLFYWYNNQPILDMAWTILPATTNRRRQEEFKKHLEDMRTILGYLCCIPDDNPDDSPENFLLRYNYEQADYYLFEPSSMVWKGLLSCIRFGETSAADDEYFDEAFICTLNQGSGWHVVEDCRIYPQSHSVSRSFLLDKFLSRTERLVPTINAVALFELDQIDVEREERVFNAFEWYNRSCSEKTPTDVALVCLAVAFETLLGVRRDSNVEKPTDGRIREKLYESMQSFLGEVPRLSIWLNQFYNARSRILHEGEWSQLRFSVTLESPKAGNPQSEYGYLIHYGWLIFRICVNSVLSGPLQVARDDLKSKFYHNQERLGRMLVTLKDDSVDAFEALNSIVEDVKTLYRYPWTYFRPVLLGTVYNVGVCLAKKLLQLGDDLNNEQKASLAKVLSETHNPEPDEIQEIIQHIVLIMQSTDELPYEKVRQPAITQLTEQPMPTLGEIRDNVQQILDDHRNKNISEELRFLLNNSVVLINSSLDRTRLKPFVNLAQRGNFITKRHLFSLIEAYASFVESIIGQSEADAGLYIAQTSLHLSRKMK